MNPKVSIILPTYNGAKYIKASIDSCLNQTYKNIELIIVDDGSIDKTKDIIEAYNDERIKYIKHNKNLGLAEALNTGFANSTGEYLTWTSDDNIYAPNSIETMVNFLNTHSEIAFVYANFYFIDENGEVLQPQKVESPEKLKDRNCIGPCFLYRKEVHETIGDYNSKIKLAEDYEYWIRVFRKFRMQNIIEFLYYYRLHHESLLVRYGDDKAKYYADQIRNEHFILSKIKEYLSIPVRAINDRSPAWVKKLIHHFHRRERKE